MTPNAELMNQARESLRGNWGLAIGTFLLLIITLGIASWIPAGSLVFGGPFALGAAYFSLSICRNDGAKLEQIFFGFNRFVDALVSYLLMVLFILLWTLLLIIPGIVAALSYSMVFFIVADDPEISGMKALDKSKAMMYGYKWKYFRLQLRIFGWALLCLLTLGIGFLWLIPWSEVSVAKFYEDIKDRDLENVDPGLIGF